MPIKINQVPTDKGGNVNSSAKGEALLSSFSKILQLFNSSSIPANMPDQKKIEKSIDSTVKSNDGQLNDLQGLEALLSTWIVGLNQTNVNQSLGQKVNTEGIKALGEWVQQAFSGSKLPTNPTELLQGLSKLLQSQEVPAGVIEKINLLIDHLNSEFPIGNVKSWSFPQVENAHSQNQNKLKQLIAGLPAANNSAGLPKIENPIVIIKLDAKSNLSDMNKLLFFDKNFVPLISTVNLDKQNKESGNDSKSKSILIDSQDQNNLVPQPVIIGTSLQRSEETTLPSNLSMPRFTTEVSEWIGSQFRVSNGDFGTTEAKLSLYPEHLGQLEIKVTSQQGQISAQFITDSMIGKEALERKIHDLTQALQQQGLIVNKLDVVYQTSPSVDTNQINFSFSDSGSNPSQEQSSYSNRRYRGEGDQDKRNSGKETDSYTYGDATNRSIVGSIDYTA